MRALHIVKEDPIKTVDKSIISESKLEKAQNQLNTYLTEIKETKDKSSRRSAASFKELSIKMIQ